MAPHHPRLGYGPARRPAAVAVPTTPGQLTPAQRARFVDEFLLDLDPRAAARRAGFPDRFGPTLLGNASIQAAIIAAKRRRLNRLELFGDEVLRRWVLLADADVNELVEVKRTNCRHCHGVDHEFQFTLNELREARRDHGIAQRRLRNPADRVPFDERGGDGYHPYRAPNPDCPECGGLGEAKVILKDTANLSPNGRLLYDGVSFKNGMISVKLRDRSRAEEMIARHAGLFNDRRPIDELDPARLTEDQLNAVVTALAERGDVIIENERVTASLPDAAPLEPVPGDDPEPDDAAR